MDKWSAAPAVVLLRKDVTSFGRFDSNDVVLANTSNHQISRQNHARMYLPVAAPQALSPTSPPAAEAGNAAAVPTEPEIEDGGSRNGIFVNGIKVARVKLCNGDTVTFGGGDEMAVGERLKAPRVQQGLTLTYTFKSRGRGHTLHTLLVAMEGEEGRPIGLVRVQQNHTMADLRSIIAAELDNPPAG